MELQRHDPADENADAPDYEWPYWQLDFPGLSEQRALKILELAQRAGLSFGGYLSSPRDQMMLSIDRATAQWLLAALADGDSRVLNLSGDGLEVISPREARRRVKPLGDDLREFIDAGDTYECEIAP
jgi:hypothetical protein